MPTAAAKPRLDPLDAAEIQRLLEPYLERFKARLLLFGSRARGDLRPASDIDVAIKAERSIPAWLMAEMRELLEESHLPVGSRVIIFPRGAILCSVLGMF
ncbi:hypothetical protein MIN45_P2163 [Methylomarinovum tepidoasis]|uniref:Polymerase nucleotidyl transferase domain-containing protein n=1 Tax=Methylomarinovum tepidoasis TaxID=2840183 RepID=A0AAU9CB63_9GAMM|nr:nucleotidyltransferase domain-containing protein [Methylomarinovum sp. IN45]BCX89790.1 hypothetical protein MIN45_P2163 [Methylomarinovum sp. IN45]